MSSSAHGFLSITLENQALLKSYRLYLRAERLALNTISNYSHVARTLAEWAGDRDLLRTLSSTDLREHWAELEATLGPKAIREWSDRRTAVLRLPRKRRGDSAQPRDVDEAELKVRRRCPAFLLHERRQTDAARH